MVRAFFFAVVCVVVLTQSFGVLVSHAHLADDGSHIHSYVVDADGHNGHSQDAAPADQEHQGEQPTARLSGLVLVFALAFVAGLRGDRAVAASPRAVRHIMRVLRPPGRHPARLALLSVLRV